MRVLVYPNTMDIGGSQMNAIDLAAAVRDRGHEVILAAEPGALSARVAAHGLEQIEIPQVRRRPSPEVVHQLVGIVHRRRIDLVHGYEWPPVWDACVGPGVVQGVPVVGTVMSMSVVPFFPRTVPLVVGTDQIREAAEAAGHRAVTLIEPPIDVDGDSPDVDGRGFRVERGVGPDEVLVAMICRLVPDLKLEGLLAACAAVGELATDGLAVRLAIVGDGRSQGEVAGAAEAANSVAGREVVFLTGALDAPEPAYAAADVIVGQGGSALRGMAFGKPLVVVGERGFSELATPESVDQFLYHGWYGLGPGSLGSGVPALRKALDPVVRSASLRAELGAFGRGLVVERFSMARAAAVQEAIYTDAVERPVRRSALVLDIAARSPAMLGAKAQRRVARWRGTVAVDDANVNSVLAQRTSA